mmetsp:Transcript_56876/g.133904  ORF Transcript_56876/g.133904 Transcript_56876/m.133904 type:complete len:164 (-) Transcript_56876:300-791(-)
MENVEGTAHTSVNRAGMSVAEHEAALLRVLVACPGAALFSADATVIAPKLPTERHGGATSTRPVRGDSRMPPVVEAFPAARFPHNLPFRVPAARLLMPSLKRRTGGRPDVFPAATLARPDAEPAISVAVAAVSLEQLCPEESGGQGDEVASRPVHSPMEQCTS